MNCNNRIVITKGQCQQKDFEMLFLLDDHDHPIEIHLNSLHHPSLIGNIYIARVSQVMPQMKAAFLEAGELKFFYPMEPIESIIFTKKNGNSDRLCQGDELVVQVVRDAIKSKEICVSTNICFSSPYVVLSMGKKKNGVSRKMEGTKREEWKTFLEQYNNQDYGIVIRTKAKEITALELADDIAKLQKEVQTFSQQVIHKTAGQLIQAAPHPFFAHIERLVDQVDEIVTDLEEWHLALMDFERENAKLRFYSDDAYPMDKLYSLHGKLENALTTKVFLPSGGYLLMEPTETLTVIDVNSGKNMKKSNAKDYYFLNNKEAAREVARQLRLRNISGMILIDFINMVDDSLEKELLKILRNEVKEDYAKVNVLDITKLGLVEVTREKKNKSLKQQVEDE